MRINIMLTMLLCFLAATGCSRDEPAVPSASLDLKVYKTPTCGCCGSWVTHIEKEGFKTEVFDQSSLQSLKKELGIPLQLQSCHTGVSEDGYFFEGHIPAKYIERFLQKPPEGALGLTVPGMPIGSPGMEVEDRFSPYDILLVKNDGSTQVFASIGSYEQQF